MDAAEKTIAPETWLDNLHNSLFCMRCRADFLLQSGQQQKYCRLGWAKIIHFCSCSRLPHAPERDVWMELEQLTSISCCRRITGFSHFRHFQCKQNMYFNHFMCRTVWPTICDDKIWYFLLFFFMQMDTLFQFSRTIFMRDIRFLCLSSRTKMLFFAYSHRTTAFRLLYYWIKCGKKNIKTSPISRIVRDV